MQTTQFMQRYDADLRQRDQHKKRMLRQRCAHCLHLIQHTNAGSDRAVSILPSYLSSGACIASALTQHGTSNTCIQLLSICVWLLNSRLSACALETSCCCLLRLAGLMTASLPHPANTHIQAGAACN